MKGYRYLLFVCVAVLQLLATTINATLPQGEIDSLSWFSDTYALSWTITSNETIVCQNTYLTCTDTPQGKRVNSININHLNTVGSETNQPPTGNLIIPELTQLNIVDLSDAVTLNVLTYIHDLPKLQVLSISGAVGVDSIPASFPSNLPALSTVSIFNTSVATLPMSIFSGSILSLQVLGNKMTDINLSNSPNNLLQTLVVSIGSAITSLTITNSHFPKLTTASFSFNSVNTQSLTISIPSLRQLSINGDNAKSIDFTGSNSITGLFLTSDFNQVLPLDLSTFTNLNNLIVSYQTRTTPQFSKLAPNLVSYSEIFGNLNSFPLFNYFPQSIQSINLMNNSISGSIPTDYLIDEIIVDNNLITGSVPSNLCRSSVASFKNNQGINDMDSCFKCYYPTTGRWFVGTSITPPTSSYECTSLSLNTTRFNLTRSQQSTQITLDGQSLGWGFNSNVKSIAPNTRVIFQLPNTTTLAPAVVFQGNPNVNTTLTLVYLDPVAYYAIGFAKFGKLQVNVSGLFEPTFEYTVQFGGKQCIVESVTPTTIVCLVDPVKNGVYQVVVSNSYGTSKLNVNFNKIYPVIYSIPRDDAFPANGSDLVIQGVFSNNTDTIPTTYSVAINGAECPVSSINATTITCTTPVITKENAVIVVSTDGWSTDITTNVPYVSSSTSRHHLFTGLLSIVIILISTLFI